jgi:hypothetical protein
MTWKIYIVDPKAETLDFGLGSLKWGDGRGYGEGLGNGWDDGLGWGYGWGGNNFGNGDSRTSWEG